MEAAEGEETGVYESSRVTHLGDEVWVLWVIVARRQGVYMTRKESAESFCVSCHGDTGWDAPDKMMTPKTERTVQQPAVSQNTDNNEDSYPMAPTRAAG